MRRTLSRRSTSFETLFDFGDKQARRDELDALMTGPAFWNDQEKAKAIIQELKSMNSVLKPFEALLRQAENLEALIELAEEGETDEFDGEIAASTKAAEAEFNSFEFRSMLGGPNDHCNAYMTIHAGAGGTEACDWSEMLLADVFDVGRGQRVQDRDHRPRGRRGGRNPGGDRPHQG